jgi:hypothetical protein
LTFFLKTQFPNHGTAIVFAVPMKATKMHKTENNGAGIWVANKKERGPLETRIL